MARGSQTPFYLGLSALFYLILLFSPLALLQTAHAQSDQDPLQENYGTVIGIDLGTTYSCVGVMQKGKVEIMVNDQGHRITPSYVAFTDDERLVGDAAKNQAAANPKNTIYDVKRMIGRKFSDKDVQGDMKHFPFDVIEKEGKPSVKVNVNGSPKVFTPEEVSP